MEGKDGLVYTPGDVAPPSERERKKQHERVDEYLVKDSFVPAHHSHQGVKRKMVVRRRKAKKEESPLGMLCAMVVEHQLGMFPQPLERVERLIWG